MAWLKTVEENNKKKEEKIRQYKANKNLIYNKIYNTRRWQKLRQSYLIDQPLCEECLKKKGKDSSCRNGTPYNPNKYGR